VDLNSFDAAYLDGLAAGDPAVEEHFVRYFGELLLIVLRSRRFHRDTINDMRQETLLRVLKAVRANEIRDPRCLRGYVHAVLKNVIREFSRADWRTSARTDDLPEPADERADSERELVTRQLQEQVRKVIAGMPAKDRELLSAVLEEKSSAEICRQFGVNANYLRVRMHRAREKFRQAVGQRSAGGHG
jgi:RNA polymerase sigma-70 factor (ECF subfamily)